MPAVGPRHRTTTIAERTIVKETRKRTRRTRGLLMETMEQRELCAVDISVSGTVLTIDGDRDDNTATVSKLSNGQYRVVHSSNGGSSRTHTLSLAESNKVQSIHFQGYEGNDLFRNDTALPSTARGDAGNDTFFGGPKGDNFRGGSGNDVLWGMDGDDHLYGDVDNDQLLGGSGVDYLAGGAGHDSLFGGDASSVDTLVGGSGNDRLLIQGADKLEDVQSGDVRIIFKNGSSRWSEAEIQVVDRAFAELQDATGSTKVLKDTVNNFDLVFQKESSGFDAAGKNSTQVVSEKYWDPWRFTWKTRHLWTERLIQIRDFNPNSSAGQAQAMDTVIHEIAHNWDSGAERSARGLQANAWNKFMAISGWRTASASTHYKSGDGAWYYSKASSQGFFGDVIATGRGNSLTYGKWNPMEDFATSVEAWFKIRRDAGPFGTAGGIAGSGRNSFAQAKLDAVGEFMRALG